jgi:hypothetical protein
MKGAKFLLKRWLSIFAHFEEDECFVSGFDFFFPAVNRFNRRQDVRAGCEFFGDELICDSLGRFAIGKRAQREKNLLICHVSGRNERFGYLPGRLGPANPAAANDNVAVVNDCGLPGRDRALRFLQLDSRAIVFE